MIPLLPALLRSTETFQSTMADVLVANDAPMLLEITATGLETVSLSDIQLPITTPPFPPPPSSPSILSLAELPANIRLPPARTTTAEHVQKMLRTLTITLNDSLYPPYTYLMHILRTLLPVVLFSPAHAHHLAHLNLVHLLLAAMADDGPSTSCHIHALNVLRPLLRDSLAQSRFAAAAGPTKLVHLLSSAAFDTSDESSARVLILCAILADAAPHLSPDSTHALRTPNAFQLFRRLLAATPAAKSQSLATHILRLLPPVISADPRVAQPLVRDHALLSAALNAMQAMPSLTFLSLQFVHTAIDDDIQNIAFFGALQSSLGLDVVLRTCRRANLTSHFLILLPNLLISLSQLDRNFQRLCLLGLVPALNDLLPKLPASSLPSTIRLLSRALSSTPPKPVLPTDPLNASTPSPYTPSTLSTTLSVVLQVLTTHNADEDIQSAGLRFAADLLVYCTANNHSLSPNLCSTAAHNAYLAITEHITQPRVLESCARLFLASTPAYIEASACPLPQLMNILRTRFHAHCSDDSASDALSDAIHALEFVASQLHNQTTESATPRYDQPRPVGRTRTGILGMSASGSLRKSFVRRSCGAQPRTSTATSNAKPSFRIWRGRRVRSDFSYQYPYSNLPQMPNTNCQTPLAADSEVRNTASKTFRASNPWRRIRSRTQRTDSATTAPEVWHSHTSRCTTARPPRWQSTEGSRVTPTMSVIMTEPLANALTRARELLTENSSSYMSQMSIPSFARRSSVGSRPSLEDSTSGSGSTPIRIVEASLGRSPPIIRVGVKDPASGVHGSVTTSENSSPESVLSARMDSAIASPTSIHSGQSDSGNLASKIGMDTLRSYSAVIKRYNLLKPEDAVWDQNYGLSTSSSSSASPSQNGAWANDEEPQPIVYNGENDVLYNSQTRISLDNPKESSTDKDSNSDHEEGKTSSDGDRIEDGTEHKADTNSSESTLVSSSDDDEFDLPFSPRSRSDNVTAGGSANLLAGTSRRSGDRERERTTERVLSGTWNRPSWIRPLSGISDHVNADLRSFPNNTFQPRVETGSLRLRR